MTSIDYIERAVGLFDLALSFARDAEKEAKIIAEFAEYYQLRCYHYKSKVAEQSGLDIFDVMAFVYSRTPILVVINSPCYRRTEATRFEYEAILSNKRLKRVVVIEAGGTAIEFPNRQTERFFELSNQTLISLVRNWR